MGVLREGVIVANAPMTCERPAMMCGVYPSFLSLQYSRSSFLRKYQFKDMIIFFLEFSGSTKSAGGCPCG